MTMSAIRSTATPPSGSSAVIDIRGLRVRYGKVEAVRDLDLQVQRGEIYGLLGPNGAGKTTTLSVLEGLRAPDSGTVSILGYDALRQAKEVKRLIGISLQSTAFFDYLNLWELVQFYAGLYSVAISRKDAIAFLDKFGLADKANRRATQLSGGQQQRVSLAIAVANNPQIVILDEPTTGLDPHARRAVWGVIRHLQAEGRTILMTTHYMEEAQELCQRIGIIDQGTIITEGTPQHLIASLGQNGLVTASAKLPLDVVQALPGVTGASADGSELTIATTNAPQTLQALTALAATRGVTLTNLSTRQPTLEDVFLARTGRKIPENVV